MVDEKPAWAEIARAYSEGDRPVADIAESIGLTSQALVRIAKERGWPLRKRLSRGRRPNPRNAKAPIRPGGVQPGALVKRIYNTIDAELTKLEQQKGATSQDRERASRALSQMVTSLEKAVDMQREIAKAKGRATVGQDKEALRHAEELRREIAERLERLHRKRTSGK